MLMRRCSGWEWRTWSSIHAEGTRLRSIWSIMLRYRIIALVSVPGPPRHSRSSIGCRRGQGRGGGGRACRIARCRRGGHGRSLHCRRQGWCRRMGGLWRVGWAIARRIPLVAAAQRPVGFVAERAGVGAPVPQLLQHWPGLVGLVWGGRPGVVAGMARQVLGVDGGELWRDETGGEGRWPGRWCDAVVPRPPPVALRDEKVDLVKSFPGDRGQDGAGDAGELSAGMAGGERGHRAERGSGLGQLNLVVLDVDGASRALPPLDGDRGVASGGVALHGLAGHSLHFSDRRGAPRRLDDTVLVLGKPQDDVVDAVWVRSRQRRWVVVEPHRIATAATQQLLVDHRRDVLDEVHDAWRVPQLSEQHHNALTFGSGAFPHP